MKSWCDRVTVQMTVTEQYFRYAPRGGPSF